MTLNTQVQIDECLVLLLSVFQDRKTEIHEYNFQFVSLWVCVCVKNFFINFLWNTIYLPHYPCKSVHKMVSQLRGNYCLHTIYWILWQVFFIVSIPALIVIVRIMELCFSMVFTSLEPIDLSFSLWSIKAAAVIFFPMSIT